MSAIVIALVEEEPESMSLDSPEVRAAASAAGYTSKRIGPALYALEFLYTARGDEALARSLMAADMRQRLGLRLLAVEEAERDA